MPSIILLPQKYFCWLYTPQSCASHTKVGEDLLISPLIFPSISSSQILSWIIVLSEEADRQDLDKIFCYELLAVKMIVWAITKVIIKFVL